MLDSDFQNELVHARLDGKNKLLVITDHFLVYADAHGKQRLPLSSITQILTDETGRLRVLSSQGAAIQGDIRSFDMLKLKAFFERAAAEIARAKQDELEPENSHSRSPVDWEEPFPPPFRSTPKLSAALILGIALGGVSLTVMLLLLPLDKPVVGGAVLLSALIAVIAYLFFSRRAR